MTMRTKRYISLFVSLMLIMSFITAFPLGADADTPAFERLSTYKQHFVRTMGSFARAEMYKNDILASLKVSQAIYESGWGESTFGTTAKNLFCIKAYSSWKGKVFDRVENIIYANLDDYRIISGANFGGSSWRAYDSWIDSIADHTALLSSGTYAQIGIPGMFDYEEAAYAVVDAGYTNDYGYSRNVIRIIEDYNLTKYDDITPNEHGVIAIEMDHAEAFVGPGGAYTLSTDIISEEAVTEQLVWASTDQTVATVSQDGTVSAKKTGFTLITASIGDREACAIVTVTESSPDYNGVVFETAVTTANLNVRAEANTQSSILGKYPEGTTIRITGPALSTGGQYDIWYPVTGASEGGSTISGWVAADFLVIGDNLRVMSQPDSSGNMLGKIIPGTYINITGEKSGGYYPIIGKSASGDTLTGWLKAEHIKLTDTVTPPEVTKVALNRYELNRDIGISYQLSYAVGSFYAADKNLTWTSSDSSVASVNNGLVTTHKYGTAVITATAASGVNASCVVTVTNQPVRYTAVTVATLYVREADSETSRAKGIINSGTTVTVTDNHYNGDGLIDDGWHYVEGEMRDGTTGIGFSKSDYIVLLAKEGEESYPREFEIAGDVIGIVDGYLYGADPTYTAGDLLAYVLNVNASVYNKNGNALTSEDGITTGCTLRLTENGITVKSIDIVIRGDVNGNGTIGSADYLIVKRCFLGSFQLEGAYLKAAQINGESVGAMDYLMIKRDFLGTYTIDQQPRN